MKIRIIYDNAVGLILPDAEVALWVNDLVRKYETSKEDYSVTVANEIIVMAVRLAVCQGRINHEDIVFVFMEQEVPMDKNARIENWPNGFCDTYDRILDGLLGF